MTITDSSSTIPADTPDWVPDFLGKGFTATTLELGTDPDGETDIYATVVRFDPSEGADASFAARPAVLWVHGMTDYFFQAHVAEALHAEGYAVYAVDLRTCGRSRRPGQRWHHATDLSLYDADLGAALDLIVGAGHPSVTPIAHSTGGLIVSLWLDRIRTSDPARHAKIAGAILNSPWIDLQYRTVQRFVVKLAAKVMSRRLPDQLTPDKGLGAYGESIHRSRSGEWDYDLTFKPLAGHVKTWSWLQAILDAQRTVHAGIEVGVPCLVLHSDRSVINQPYSPALDTADAVLDVEQIAARTRCLGSGATNVAIPGARHDVFLSLEHARAQALSETLGFLREHAPTPAAD